MDTIESIARREFEPRFRDKIEPIITDKIYLEELCNSLMSKATSCHYDTTKSVLLLARNIIKTGIEKIEFGLETLKKDLLNQNILTEGKFDDLCAAVVQKQEYSVSGNSFTSLQDEIQHDTEDAQATEEKIYEHEAENVNDNTIEDYDEEAVSKTDDSQSTGEESNDHNVDNVNVESNTDITGPGPGDDVIQKIASTLASEDIDALKTVADEKKKSEDDYFRRTLLFSKMKFKHEESYYNFKHEESYYKTCIQVLKYYNLMSLFDRCEKFYVTQKGDIRLTFATRRECIFMLLQAKRTLQKEYKWGSKISVEIMCPRAELKKKMRLKYLGRQGKEQGKIHSYDVIQKKVQGFFVLKLRIYKRGVGYRVLNEDEIQTAIDNIEEFHPNNEE